MHSTTTGIESPASTDSGTATAAGPDGAALPARPPVSDPLSGVDPPTKTLSRRLAPLIPAVVIMGWLLGFGSSFQLYLAGTVLIYATAAIGLDLLMGRAGQISIGTAAMLAVGGYSAAIVAQYDWAPFPVPLLVAAVCGGIVGLIVGVPALRLQGIYLALATLALHFIILFAAEQYQARTGEVAGIPLTPPELFGFTFTYGRSWVILAAVVLGLMALLLSNMYRRAPGRNWTAIRESELAASTIGVSPTRWKLIAFVGSSMVIALAGGLLAYYTLRVSSEQYTLDLAIEFIIMIVIGGRGSIWGAMVGAAVINLAPQFMTWLTDSLPANFILTPWLQDHVFTINNGLYGLIVLLFLLYQPGGIVPGLKRAGRWVLNRRNRPADERAAELDAPEPDAEEPRIAVEPLRISRVTEIEESRHREAGEPPPLLVVNNLHLRYPNGALALDHTNLEVGQGEIVAILGRNGAGKTSLLRAITGFFKSERVKLSGEVLYDGENVIGSLPMKTSKMGIVLVPERNKVFPSLTVAEHLKYLGDVDRARDTLPKSATELFERRWDSPAGLLSGGERQLLAISVAASLDPRLMLIDEMSLGLAPSMIESVTVAVAEMQETTGIGVLVVEQNAAVAERLAHRALRIEIGRVMVDDHLEEEATSIPAVSDSPSDETEGSEDPTGRESTRAGR